MGERFGICGCRGKRGREGGEGEWLGFVDDGRAAYACEKWHLMFFRYYQDPAGFCITVSFSNTGE